MSLNDDKDEPTKETYKELNLPSEETSLTSHMIINLNANMLVMSQMVGEMSVAVKQVAVRIKEIEVRRRRDRLVFGFSIVIVLMVAVFVLSQIRSNEEQLRILRNATSPEAAAATSANLQKIVKQIDCNDKETGRELLLAIQKLVPEVSIPQEDPVCPLIATELTPTTER